MKKNDSSTRLMLELISSSIWSREVKSEMFEDVDENQWSDIIRLAVSQRLQGLIADGVKTLKCNMPTKIAASILMYKDKTIKANEYINQSLLEIADIYNSHDFRFILLKGQGNALAYPNPLCRTPGDLDIFLYRKDDFARAKSWLEDRKYSIDEDCIHHLSYERNGVHIENHRLLINLDTHKTNTLVAHKVREIVKQANFETIEINGAKINVLPSEFNTFYVFAHLFRHFLHVGVGLRQICDWNLLFAKYFGSIERDSFTKLAKKFRLLKAMQIFAQLSIKYLSSSPEIFPFDLGKTSKYVDLVMDDVLEGGYFGTDRPGKKRPKGKWSGRWHGFKKSMRRVSSFYPIAPHYILQLPIIKIGNRIRLLFKNGL